MRQHLTRPLTSRSSCKPAQGPPHSRVRGKATRIEKALQMLKELRCGKCNRLLAKATESSEVQIKCPRCGTFNQKAASFPSCAPSSAQSGGRHGKTTEATPRTERL